MQLNDLPLAPATPTPAAPTPSVRSSAHALSASASQASLASPPTAGQSVWCHRIVLPTVLASGKSVRTPVWTSAALTQSAR